MPRSTWRWRPAAVSVTLPASIDRAVPLAESPPVVTLDGARPRAVDVVDPTAISEVAFYGLEEGTRIALLEEKAVVSQGEGDVGVVRCDDRRADELCLGDDGRSATLAVAIVRRERRHDEGTHARDLGEHCRVRLHPRQGHPPREPVGRDQALDERPLRTVADHDEADVRPRRQERGERAQGKGETLLLHEAADEAQHGRLAERGSPR